jgi:hypothetical protein
MFVCCVLWTIGCFVPFPLSIIFSVLFRYTTCDYRLVIFSIYDLWLPPCYLFDIRLVITPLLSFRYTTCDYALVIFSIYDLWLPPCYLFNIRLVITPLLSFRYTTCDYTLVIFKLFLLFVHVVGANVHKIINMVYRLLLVTPYI